MPTTNPNSENVTQSQRKYKPDALRAVKALRRTKAWQGTVEERLAKFQSLNAALAAAYGVAPPTVEFIEADSNNGHYNGQTHTIQLVGRLSVVTYLHEFAHVLGMNQRQAICWSVNLFRRCFPRSFERCEMAGELLVQREPHGAVTTIDDGNEESRLDP